MKSKKLKQTSYKWTRPEYNAFLMSGKTPRTTEEIQNSFKNTKSDQNEGPSRGNYWG